MNLLLSTNARKMMMIYIIIILFTNMIDSYSYIPCDLAIGLGIFKLNQKLINWSNYKYKLNEVIISDNLISEAINTFWIKHVETLSDDQHIVCLFRVKSNDGIVTTLGNLTKLKKDDKEYYIQHIINILYHKNDEYKTQILTEAIINFGQRQGRIDKKPLNLESIQKSVFYQNYKKHKLPVTMDPIKYGKLIYFDEYKNTYLVQITDKSIASINVKDGINTVEIIREGDIVMKYTDQMLNENYILRKIGNNTYHYTLDGNLNLTKVIKPHRYMKTQQKSVHINNKFLTLDLETILIKNKQVPYLACIYDGKTTKSFYLSDYNGSVKNMFNHTLLSLCRFKYNKHVVYVHNLANFDGIFLLKEIVNIKHSKVNLLYNNDKIISIDLKYQKPEWKNPIEISFRDSYQILPSSLANLAKCFNINIHKGIFPFRFINDLVIKISLNKTLNWKGNIPSINYFDNISNEEYINYCNIIKKEFNNKWSFRYQAMIYCMNDCIALYNVLTAFNKFYFDLFKININNAPTLASHAFRLFRTHFLEKDCIQMIYGKDHDIIRTGYTGGATDMYIPSNNIGEKVYAYDVNSLYPFVMKNNPMPTGIMSYFDGDITQFENKPFGFFYCEIEAPNNLKHPILQLHVNINNKGTRTIAPLGTFKGLFFSEELYNAQKYGYKFKVLWGYTFEKKFIFNKFVEKLYNLRLQYPKDHPLHFIAKLLLNSLYGRFGMRDIFNIIKIVSKEQLDILIDNNNQIEDVIDLDNHFIVKIFNKFDEDNETQIKKKYNVNIAIASAVTAYARIYMSQFKNHPKLKLFYTDTDSIYTNLNPNEMNELFPGIVNNKELGKLKLENISDKAIFLAPKAYCLQTVEGEFIYKIKGLIKNVPVSVNDFEKLLLKGSLVNKTQTKWYKSLTEGSIELLEQSYTLQQTDN